ncbi:MAG: hypothetical protein WA417_01225 [Stellaceae bacterium]
MPSLGTRTKQGLKYERLAQGSMTRTYTRDLHMTKLVSASITFTSSNGRATGANGTFPTTGFVVNDPMLIEGANLNNGYFTITGLDATNQSTRRRRTKARSP